MAQTIGTSNKVDVWADDGTVVEPASSKVDVGWQLGEQPPHEFMNWLQNTFGQKLNHVLQHGVPRWNDATEYGVGDFVTHNDQLYRAINVNTNSEPPSGNWQSYEIQSSSSDLTPDRLVLTQSLASGLRIRSAPTVITSSGTYTPDAEVRAVLFEVQGAGGGGGGSSSLGGDNNAGAGGSGGGYSKKFITEVASSYAIEVGASGTAGSSANSGGDGGSTTVTGTGVDISASGGGGGEGVSAGSNPQATVPGTSGSVSGGDINVRGWSGSPGLKLSSAARASGKGGDSFLGRGGRSVATNSATASAVGNDGSGFGGGGGGGVSSDSTATGGGNGASGAVVIWEFV